jgi:hypothetical protein
MPGSITYRAPERSAFGAFALSPAPGTRQFEYEPTSREEAKYGKTREGHRGRGDRGAVQELDGHRRHGIPWPVGRQAHRAAARARRRRHVLFVGPTAITFITGEPVNAAKALKTFAKDNKALIIKGGYMDGAPLSVSEVERIADLETREVLLAKLAGALKGNLAKAAGLFNAPASQVARLAAALQEKKQAEEGGSAAE